MQNSIKHSHCKNIEISISNTSKRLRLFLQDDGIGFDIKKEINKGIGLKNIKKRIEILGGIYSLESKINIGTKLTIEIPL
jgi:signal transduction histidine kinase